MFILKRKFTRSVSNEFGSWVVHLHGGLLGSFVSWLVLKWCWMQSSAEGGSPNMDKMYRIYRAYLIVIGALLVLAGGSVAAPEKPLLWVAVMPYNGLGVDSVTALQTEEAMSDGLTQSKKIRVMERSQMSDILREQSFQKSGACDSSECAVQTGKLLGVDLVVVGSIGKFGSAYTLSSRVVKVQTGEVVHSARRVIKGDLDGVLTTGIPSLSRELAFALAGEPVPADVASVPEPQKKPEEPSSSWGWWLGGTVLVATAAGAAWFLIADKKSTSANTVSDPNSGVTVVDVVVP